MFFRNVAETRYSIKLNDGGYRIVYEFTGSKEHLELVSEEMQKLIIEPYRIKTKKPCGGCGKNVSNRN